MTDVPAATHSSRFEVPRRIRVAEYLDRDGVRPAGRRPRAHAAPARPHARTSPASVVEQLRDGVERHPGGQRAVADADERGADGVEPDHATEPATLAELDHGRLLVAGAAVPLLGHVVGAPPGDRQQLVVVVLGQPGAGAQPGQHVRPHRCGHRTGRLGQVDEGLPLPHRPLQGDHPEPDRTHAARREVVEPRGIHRRELGGGAVVTAVARPGLGVLGRVLHVALHDPRVEAGAGHPAAHPLAPVGVADDLPVAEELGDTAGLEVVADRAHEVGDDGVTRPARRRGTRTAGTSGVRGVMTKGGLLTMSPNRCPATGSSIEPSTTSQSRPLSSALNRANSSARVEMSVTVTCRACAAEVQGLHAAPGADVEGALDGRSRGPRRQAWSRPRRCPARGPHAAARGSRAR